jgi:hypothetical protein
MISPVRVIGRRHPARMPCWPGNVAFARDDEGADRAAEPLHQRREGLLEQV